MNGPKTMKTMLFALLLLPLLNGCVTIWEGHPTTYSAHQSEQEKAFWADRQASKDKSLEWQEQDRIKSRARMAEYFP